MAINIANGEPLRQRVRKPAKARAGRENARERVSVEHSLAHANRCHASRARRFGSRNKTIDPRRAAIIQNLEITQGKAA